MYTVDINIDSLNITIRYMSKFQITNFQSREL